MAKGKKPSCGCFILSIILLIVFAGFSADEDPLELPPISTPPSYEVIDGDPDATREPLITLPPTRTPETTNKPSTTPKPTNKPTVTMKPVQITPTPKPAETVTVPSGFYYTQLDKEGKIIYAELYKAVIKGEDTIQLSGIELPEYTDSVKPAIYAFEYDHPQFFWTGNGYSYTSSDSRLKNNDSLKLTISTRNYWKYTTSRNSYVNKLQQKVNQIVSEANKYSTDYEKIKYVHDYIVNTVQYDHTAASETETPTKMSAKSEQSCTAYGALVNGWAICCGYSEAFQLIMHNLGISCDVVIGYANGGLHEWNAVYINGVRYMLDATWDDPDWEPIRYDYFLISTAQLEKTHKVKDTQFTYPVCKYNYAS